MGGPFGKTLEIAWDWKQYLASLQQICKLLFWMVVWDIKSNKTLFSFENCFLRPLQVSIAEQNERREEREQLCRRKSNTKHSSTKLNPRTSHLQDIYSCQPNNTLSGRSIFHISKIRFRLQNTTKVSTKSFLFKGGVYVIPNKYLWYICTVAIYILIIYASASFSACTWLLDTW